MTISLDHLEQATGGDWALGQELLALFRDQVKSMSAWLDRFPSRAVPAPEFAQHLHRLRGAAQAVGAERLAAEIRIVEEQCGGDAASGCMSEGVDALRRCLSTTILVLDDLIAAREQGGLAKPVESG